MIKSGVGGPGVPPQNSQILGKTKKHEQHAGVLGVMAVIDRGMLDFDTALYSALDGLKSVLTKF